jgi:eukaryotic-like serine/threonine-protein kinase
MSLGDDVGSSDLASEPSASFDATLAAVCRDEEALADTVERLHSTLRLADTASIGPHTVLRPGLKTTGRTAFASLESSLPALRVSSPDRPDPEADILITGVLGSGGMGVVQLAEQRSLRRQVAIKRLHGAGRNPGDPEEPAGLLREALLGGSLDHPNVVPIHALGRDDHGPLLVMKRVEGRSWSELIATPTVEYLSGRAPMERHIEILIQVCNAVDFAHSRGIVHRDLKPDNVMVGRFGEVYLLDWGVACELESRDTADLGPIGTPCYMAPEMLFGSGGISERTDVYLLGATLHEIVSGRVRHDGNDLRSVLRSVLLSQPVSYGHEVPEELGAICNRATALWPADRFAIVLTLYTLAHGLTWLMGAPLYQAVVSDFLIVGAAMSMLAIFAEQRVFVLTAVLFLAGAALVARFPSHIYEIFAAIAMVATLPVAVRWIHEDRMAKGS